MPDREKVIKGLEHCSFGENRGCAGCPYNDECGDWGRDSGVGSLCTDALALLTPRVLTISEVKHIGVDNLVSLKNDGLTVLWLEEFGKQFPLHVVILKWDEDDWDGNDNEQTDVYYFGTDEFDHFALSQYGKTWRCWTDKPTESQREAVSWIA